MAPRDFESAKTLLPRFLARLAKESGRSGGLAILWEDVAGPAISAAMRPLRAEGDVLVVSVPDSSWMKRLDEHASELGKRLDERTSGQLRNVRGELKR